MSFLLEFLATLVGFEVSACYLESQDLGSNPIQKISQKIVLFCFLVKIEIYKLQNKVRNLEKTKESDKN